MSTERELNLLAAVSTALADIEAQLAQGNTNTGTLGARLEQALALLARAQPAPQVTVNTPPAAVTVHPPPVPSHDWKHVHVYDQRGRCVETISTRTTKG